MDTIKFDKKNVKMVAHRGLSGIETENTASAFVAAGNHSYYGIETDIHKTKDGKFIVIHDNDLLRVAGNDLAVEDSTLAEAQKIILRDKNGGFGRADLIAPAFEDYLSICKKYGKHAVVELKSTYSDGEIDNIIKIVESFDYLESTTFISFLYANLGKIRKRLPSQSLQYLFGTYSDLIFEKLIEDKIDVDINHKALTKELVDKFHEAGMVVNCWTVDNPERAAELTEWGVDMITSNILE